MKIAVVSPTKITPAPPKPCRKFRNITPRVSASAAADNKPDGLGLPLASTKRSPPTVEARSLPPQSPEPAPLGPSFTDLNGVASSPTASFDRVLNLGVLGAAGAVAVAIALHAGPNPWESYQQAVAVNPIETKACISGVVYSLGDLIAQAYEGREVAEWDRGRIIRSGLCGFLAHGPLSHLYYVALDHGFTHQSLIPTDSWLVPLFKVGIDQTAWSILWNSTYYVLLGLLKMESPDVILTTVRATWWDLLKAGWRLWPLVHLFTYGIIPVQHRLLFVDTVELVWVSILSMYGQQQRRRMEEEAEASGAAPTWVACALPGADGEGGDPAEEILRGLKVEHEIVFESAETGERVVMSPAEVYASSSSEPAGGGGEN